MRAAAAAPPCPLPTRDCGTQVLPHLSPSPAEMAKSHAARTEERLAEAKKLGVTVIGGGDAKEGEKEEEEGRWVDVPSGGRRWFG